MMASLSFRVLPALRAAACARGVDMSRRSAARADKGSQSRSRGGDSWCSSKGAVERRGRWRVVDAVGREVAGRLSITSIAASVGTLSGRC